MAKKIFQIIILLILVVASFAGTGNAAAWSGCGQSYTVQWGDTLSEIAARCGTTVYAIQLANPGLGYWVYAGQVLIMPGASWEDNHGGELIHIVAYGDTLKKIAARYGTTMYAIASLNGIYNYDLIFVGQRLRIPSGSYVPPQPPAPPAPPPNGCGYVIQRGDTLRKLAYRWGFTVYDILAVNPQITNASLIYAGQCIAIPGGSNAPSAQYYTVKRGDTLRIIANLYGTTVYNLQLLNPQIWNPNFIYAGMVIRVR